MSDSRYTPIHSSYTQFSFYQADHPIPHPHCRPAHTRGTTVSFVHPLLESLPITTIYFVICIMFMPCSPCSSPVLSSSSSSIPMPFTKCRSSSPPSTPIQGGWISYYKINYQEISKLGRGAGGDAFLCRNNIDENLYAIKKIRAKVSEAARLKEEAVILRHLDHPNIVRYYQVLLAPN